MVATARPSTLTIKTVPRERLRECAEFARDVFGFSPLEATPPSHLYTTSLHGAIVLGAFEEERLVGHVYAFPAYRDGETYLYSTGLSVRTDTRNQGIGYQLMSAMRNSGLALGYDAIAWTTDAMDSKNLYLYLAKCRARLVAYHPMMYDQLYQRVKPTGAAGDDVEFVWALTAERSQSTNRGGPAEAGRPVTATEVVAGVRRFVTRMPAEDADSYVVEVPWNAAGLEAYDEEAATEWRLGVRAAMIELLDAGYVGTDAVIDRGASRCFVGFERLG